MEDDLFEEESLSFTNLNNQELLKGNGEISGKDIKIQNLNTCQVFLLDYCSQVTIDSCQNTLFVIGPTSQQILIKNCQNCQISATCKALEVSVSTDLTLYLFIATNPKINNSNKILFAPFNYAYPMQDSHLKIAKIPLDNNYWNEVKDLTIEENKAHWKLLDPAQFKLLEKEVLTIPVKPINPFPLPISYKTKTSSLANSTSEISKGPEIAEINITENISKDIIEDKKILEETKGDNVFSSPSNDDSKSKNYEEFKFNSPSIEEVKNTDNVPNLVKFNDSSPEISKQNEINNKTDIQQHYNKDENEEMINLSNPDKMINEPRIIESKKEIPRTFDAIQKKEAINDLYHHLDPMSQLAHNDKIKEESKLNMKNVDQTNNDNLKPENNFNFDEFKGEEQKINFNINEGFAVPEDTEFQKEETKAEEKADKPELGFHRYDEDELEPSKREKSPGKEYDFTAEEQDRINKVQEEERIRMNLIYEKQMKEQNDKEEKKDYGKNWLDEWKVKRKKALLEKRVSNKKDEAAMIEGLKEKKRSPNPWERVVSMVELKEGNYPGTKSVARMRQSILGRKNDIKTGLSKIDN